MDAPEPDQRIHVRALTSIGDAGGGDFGYLDVLDDDGRLVRLSISHLGLQPLEEAVAQLRSAVAREREAHGKTSGAHEIVAKAVDVIQVGPDHTQNAVLVRFVHPDKTSSNFLLEPSAVPQVAAELLAAMEKLKAKPVPRPN